MNRLAMRWRSLLTPSQEATNRWVLEHSPGEGDWPTSRARMPTYVGGPGQRQTEDVLARYRSSQECEAARVQREATWLAAGGGAPATGTLSPTASPKRARPSQRRLPASRADDRAWSSLAPLRPARVHGIGHWITS